MRILIRLLKFAIWLLPVGMACYVVYTVVSPGFALWQSFILTLVALLSAYLAWHMNRRIVPEFRREPWNRVRLAMLAALAGAMLFSTTSAIILQNDRNGMRVGSVGGISTGVARLMISAAMYAERRRCEDENENSETPADCDVCIKPDHLTYENGLLMNIGQLVIEYEGVDCSTYAIRYSNLSPRGCTSLLNWIDTAWLSKITIGPDTSFSTGFNRPHAALCRAAPKPLVVELEYSLPDINEWVEASHE